MGTDKFVTSAESWMGADSNPRISVSLTGDPGKATTGGGERQFDFSQQRRVLVGHRHSQAESSHGWREV